MRERSGRKRRETAVAQTLRFQEAGTERLEQFLCLMHVLELRPVLG